MAQNLIRALEPIREKRDYYENRPERVDEIIIEGSSKARKVAGETMGEVRAAMRI
jgi:tryptophanyl-tRNA synthetase